jgi:hypothetical protein
VSPQAASHLVGGSEQLGGQVQPFRRVPANRLFHQHSGADSSDAGTFCGDVRRDWLIGVPRIGLRVLCPKRPTSLPVATTPASATVAKPPCSLRLSIQNPVLPLQLPSVPPALPLTPAAPTHQHNQPSNLRQRAVCHQREHTTSLARCSDENNQQSGKRSRRIFATSIECSNGRLTTRGV